MNEYIKEIEEIATKCSCSQSDGYAQIMRIYEAMKEEQTNNCEDCLNTEYIQDKLSESCKSGYKKAITDVCKEIGKRLSGDTKHLSGDAYTKECAYLDIM